MGEATRQGGVFLRMCRTTEVPDPSYRRPLMADRSLLTPGSQFARNADPVVPAAEAGKAVGAVIKHWQIAHATPSSHSSAVADALNRAFASKGAFFGEPEFQISDFKFHSQMTFAIRDLQVGCCAQR